ncbi:MAG: hypothetical protein AAFN04_10000 [Pseudomonadota bacterium]
MGTRGATVGWLALAALCAAFPAFASDRAQTDEDRATKPIIVTAPLTEAERRKQLRAFTREIIRPPRKDRPIARFRFPICPKVKGLAPEDARAIEARIRENAQRLGSGANEDPNCTPSVRVAFMAPGAGAAVSWLNEESEQLSHLPTYQRRRVLSEKAPVRAWSKVVLRDQLGQPLRLLENNGRVIGGQDSPILVDQFSASDPIHTSEITGAAILIEREAAEGFTLAQLADYITMRTFLGTQSPDAELSPAAATILTLFRQGDPPTGLTLYDKALVESVYKASRQSTPRRVIATTASTAARAEQRRSDAPGQ